MNSKPTTTTTSPRPYKFLTRNLNISDENGNVFQKVCLKRVYLKKIIDKRRRGSDPDEKVYRPFKKNKLFKALTAVQIPCIHQSYAHESFKSSKLLKSFYVDACSDNPSLQKVALYISKDSLLQSKILDLKSSEIALYLIKAFISLQNLFEFSRI